MQTETYEQKLDRERKEKKARVAASVKKVLEVASILGYAAENRNDEHEWADSVNVKLTNGHYHLHVSGEGYAMLGKLHVSVYFPTSAKGQRTDDYVCGYNQPARPSINVSASKTAEQIAKDIERRLLPEYRPLLEKALDLIAKWDAFEDKRMKNFMAVVGRKPKEGYESERYETDVKNATVKVSAEDVSLNITGLTVGQARAILASLGA